MDEATKQKPGIGVAIVVWKDSAKKEFLLGLGHSVRNRSEIYAVPGGHWESGETLVEAVRRETLEEAGVTVRDIRLVSVYEFFNSEKNKSYVTIGFEGVLESGVPTVLEPDNKEDWGWYRPDDTSGLSLFAPDRTLIDRAISGIVYDTSGSAPIKP